MQWKLSNRMLKELRERGACVQVAIPSEPGLEDADKTQFSRLDVPQDVIIEVVERDVLIVSHGLGSVPNMGSILEEWNDSQPCQLVAAVVFQLRATAQIRHLTPLAWAQPVTPWPTLKQHHGLITQQEKS